MQKRRKFNRTCLKDVPDDCLEIVVLYLDSIHSVNSFELACKCFRNVVLRLYERRFGKKEYSDFDEFVKIFGPKDLPKMEENTHYIYYEEVKDRRLSATGIHSMDLNGHALIYHCKGTYCLRIKSYQEKIYAHNLYSFIHPIYCDVIEDTSFRKFLQKIRGYFYIRKSFPYDLTLNDAFTDLGLE